MRYLYALVLLLLAVIMAGFIGQNIQPISVRYFSWQTPSLPLSFYLLAAFAGGYLLAVLLGLFGRVSARFRLRRAEREVRRLTDEVARLESDKGMGGGTAAGEGK